MGETDRGPAANCERLQLAQAVQLCHYSKLENARGDSTRDQCSQISVSGVSIRDHGPDGVRLEKRL